MDPNNRFRFAGFAFGLLLIACGQSAGSWRHQTPAPTDTSSPELRIDLREFKKLLDSNTVFVIDVNDQDAYRTGHIPGAIWLPMTAIDDQMDTLKQSHKTIVAYCR